MNTVDVVVEANPQHGLVVTSRNLAKGLNKRHSDVLESIDRISENGDFRFLFIPTFYRVQNQKRNYKEYLLTKDGFTLYMFNIQGYLDFKMAYIKRFNEMEKALTDLQVKPLPQPALPENPTPADIKRKTFGGVPVMDTADLAILAGVKERSVIWHVQKANIQPIKIEGERLRRFKHENPHEVEHNAAHKALYYEHDVKSWLAYFDRMEMYQAFVTEYFMPDYNPNMSLEEMQVAVQQAETLFKIAKRWRGEKQQEWLFRFITEILINIGLWNDKHYGYSGVTAEWGIETLEGWNKQATLYNGLFHLTN